MSRRAAGSDSHIFRRQTSHFPAVPLVDRLRRAGEPVSPDPGFPWGDNHPTRAQRIIVAICLATFAATLTASVYAHWTGYHSDFALSWFGATSLIHHVDPYPLVGPGRFYEWRWPLLYPATAFAAALPFALLSEQAASVTFVWIAAFLLSYGMTRHSWHLVPLFASYSFASSAWLAQWSLIFTAALFLPWLGFLTVAKPQTGIPVLAESNSRVTLLSALIGGAVLIAVSLFLLPSWPREWWALARVAGNVRPPIGRFGGILVLLVLLRWRRREAWLVLAMAVMPATWGWYNALMLLTIAKTYREACVLSLMSTAGGTLGGYFIPPVRTMDEFDRFAGAVLVATAYLPAVFVVLRRPNEGELPAWLQIVVRLTAWRPQRGAGTTST
jgi:hypothetical protein